MTVAATAEDLKTTKKWTDKRLRIKKDLGIKNSNFKDLGVFDFAPKPKSKTCKSWKFIFYFKIDSCCSWRFKNDKKLNLNEKQKVQIRLKKRKRNIRGFRVFDFTLHPKSNTRISWLFVLYNVITMISYLFLEKILCIFTKYIYLHI